jgi:hypothetical protein
MALLVPEKLLVSSPGERFEVKLFAGRDRLADDRHGSGDHGRRERKRRLPTSSTTNATDAPEIHASLSPVLSPLVFGSASMRTTTNVR